MQKIILLLLLISLVSVQAKETYLQVYTNGRKFNIKVSLANFGYFKYGHKLTGRVHIGANYTDWGDDVTKDRIEKKGKDKNQQTEIVFDNQNDDMTGCFSEYQQFNQEYIEEYGHPIYIVDRGNCTFVKKSSNAAISGKMLIIVDNSQDEDIENVIMIDDLSGDKIMIPVVMISNKDGNMLKQFLFNEMQDRTNNEDKQVWISIVFNKPQEGSKAEIQYWMLPSDKTGYTFLRNHSDFINNLIYNNKTIFEPHIIFFKCDDKCKAQHAKEIIDMDKFCIFDGEFCHPDPDGNGPLTGVDSLYQAITELCVHSLFPQYLLSYFFGFHTCYVENGTPFNECNIQAQNHVIKNNTKADNENFRYKVQECQKFNTITDPVLPRAEYNLFIQQGLKFYPALFVNGDIFRGDLGTQEAAEEFICEGIEHADEVNVCDEYTGLMDDNDDKWSGKFGSKEDSNIIWIICAALLVVFIIGLFVYRRKIKMEVQKELAIQVDTAIQQYYALNESK